MSNHRLRTALFTIIAGLAVGCGGGGGTVATDGGALTCAVDAVTSCPADGPTFATVEPIIANRCTPCHAGVVTDGPWPLRTYDEIVSWSDEVRTMLLHCEMPPPNQPISLSDEDRTTLLTWLRCDSPR